MNIISASRPESGHRHACLKTPWSLWLGYLNQPISLVPGIGEKTVKKLGRLNIRCVKDLLFHFPIRHQTFASNADAEHQSLTITVLSHALGPKYLLIRGKTVPDKQEVSLFFHKKQYSYLKTHMTRGSCWIIWGKGTFSKARWTFFFPRTKPFTPNVETISETIYPQTSDLPSRTIQASIKRILETMPQPQEWLPEDFRVHKNWPSHDHALRIMHYLEEASEDTRDDAFARLSFDRILARHALSLHLRHQQQDAKAIPCNAHTKRFEDSLRAQGFTLTPSQQKASNDIHRDLTRTYPMRRLLQGDVGSGKTLVAMDAMIKAVDSETRVAYLAPTEILAEQVHHIYQSFNPSGVEQCALLTKSSPQKKKLIEAIAQGYYNVIVGTHALLREDVHVPDLGLVVIDEQQRFGVAQRARLMAGHNHTPHLLLMTATPIPRTYSLMMKGHIDTSYLKARIPSMRTTHLLDVSRLSDVVQKVKSAIESGKQIFWICSCVEENETKAAVKKRFEALKPLFLDKVRCLYSQQSSAEKQDTLSLFRMGHIKLLIASTVVEIGIDVPNASHMIIEDIQQFGLSQLHQLRGRIGRKGQESVLLGLYKTPLSQHARRRLVFFQKYDDGFDIARHDLLLRGEGDITGTHQSGFLDPRFTMNAHMIRDAANIAPKLEPEVCQALLELFENQNDLHMARRA